MTEYLDKLYGKKERYSDTLKKQKKKKPVERVPDEVSEEEVFVEYEASRPGFRSWLAGLFSSSPQEVPDDLPETEAKVLEDMEDEIEELDDEIEELEEARESLWTRFLKSMRSSRRSEAAIRDDLLDDVVPAIDEDVKSILKVIHAWLEKLPPSEMAKFKQSGDFQEYKLILEKYGLIKK